MSRSDDFFLPGVSLTFEGESVPANELAWAMDASCGCVAAVHSITSDTMNETAAWKQMSGNAAMQKRDKARGFTIRMGKHHAILDAFKQDCPHSPKWGYVPPPTPPGFSWATTMWGRGSSSGGKALHLVALTALDDEQAKKLGREWAEEGGPYRDVESVCQRAVGSAGSWTRKWYRTTGKVECARCVKIAEKQVLALELSGHPTNHPCPTCGHSAWLHTTACLVRVAIPRTRRTRPCGCRKALGELT